MCRKCRRFPERCPFPTSNTRHSLERVEAHMSIGYLSGRIQYTTLFNERTQADSADAGQRRRTFEVVNNDDRLMRAFADGAYSPHTEKTDTAVDYYNRPNTSTEKSLAGKDSDFSLIPMDGQRVVMPSMVGTPPRNENCPYTTFFVPILGQREY